MKNVRRFSIVAPNYNEVPHIENLFFNGLIRQTWKDFDVIIVDGCSNDGSLEVIEKYSKILDVDTIFSRRRNLGYIRNLGASVATGEIMVQTNTDCYLPPNTLEMLDIEFEHSYRLPGEPELVAIGGRVIPTGQGSGIICHLAYGMFDLARFFMTTKFWPVKKIRPSGNFLAINLDVFKETGGYPEVRTNEDGLYGYKLDEYQVAHPDKSVMFSLDFHVFHNVKTFVDRGPIGGVLFYAYVIGLMIPKLAPMFKHIEKRTGDEFFRRVDDR